VGKWRNYIGRHGSKRVAKLVLVGAVPPLMLKTNANPEGAPIGVFDDIRRGTATSRSQFFKDLTIPFYGFNRPASLKSIPRLSTRTCLHSYAPECCARTGQCRSEHSPRADLQTIHKVLARTTSVISPLQNRVLEQRAS
jgi:hypothetical protein